MKFQNFLTIKKAIETNRNISQIDIDMIKAIKLMEKYDKDIDILIRVACEFENIPVLKVLLYDGSESQEIFMQLGANINHMYFYDNHLQKKDSCLIHYIASLNKPYVLTTLLEHMLNPFVIDKLNGDTILTAAIRAKHFESVVLIIKKFPSLLLYKNQPYYFQRPSGLSAMEVVAALIRTENRAEDRMILCKIKAYMEIKIEQLRRNAEKAEPKPTVEIGMKKIEMRIFIHPYNKAENKQDDVKMVAPKH